MSEGNGAVTRAGELSLCLTRQELLWLLGRLEELPIPSPEGKMLAASIQVKGMAALEAE